MLAKYLSVISLACAIGAQSPLIYSNGPFVTHPAGGSGGADASVLQNVAPLNHTTYGYGAQGSLGYAVADNFVVNGTWIVDRIRVFSYQTGSTTTSTLTGVGLQVIQNGAPGVGTPVTNSPLLATNNVPAATGWTGCYRTLVADQATATNRPIMYADVSINPPMVLTTGVYWLEYNIYGTLASGPWAPPVVVPNQGPTGDGMQQLGVAAAWAAVINGTVDGAGFPFELYGASTSGLGNISNIGGGCGTASLSVRGQPAMGGFIHSELSGTTQPLTAIGVGFTNPNGPLPCSCIQHSSFDVLQLLVTTYSFNLPVDSNFVGLNLFVQGVEVGTGPCALGAQFQATDGFQVSCY